MKRLAIALCLVFVVAPSGAAPKAKSAAECAAYADMALLLATAERHGIERERAAQMLPDIYSYLFEDRGDEAIAIAAALVSAAYAWRAAQPASAPREFAELLGATCMRYRGDMDSLLGTES